MRDIARTDPDLVDVTAALHAHGDQASFGLISTRSALLHPYPIGVADPNKLFVTKFEGLLSATRLERSAKRVLDVVMALIGLAVLMPVFLLVGIAVKASSPGSVFYRQTRIGRDGKPFQLVKFRTMYVDADQRKAQLQELNELDGPVFKIREDPRITPIGRVLRKFSLDELPQFFHVLSGSMSMVGPRPPLPEEVAQYGPWERQRLLVKPGITCIWQVSGRNDLDFETWVALDVEYIKTWTLGGDLSILAKTIPAVVTARGAY